MKTLSLRNYFLYMYVYILCVCTHVSIHIFSSVSGGFFSLFLFLFLCNCLLCIMYVCVYMHAYICTYVYVPPIYIYIYIYITEYWVRLIRVRIHLTPYINVFYANPCLYMFPCVCVWVRHSLMVWIYEVLYYEKWVVIRLVYWHYFKVPFLHS